MKELMFQRSLSRRGQGKRGRRYGVYGEFVSDLLLERFISAMRYRDLLFRNYIRVAGCQLPAATYGRFKVGFF